jgi:hypothetical protein
MEWLGPTVAIIAIIVTILTVRYRDQRERIGRFISAIHVIRARFEAHPFHSEEPFRASLTEIGTAVRDILPYLSRRRRRKLTATWIELQQLPQDEHSTNIRLFVGEEAPTFQHRLLALLDRLVVIIRPH